MIRINLATRKQSASAAGESVGGGSKINLDQIRARLGDIQDLPLRKIGSMIAFMMIASYFWTDYQGTEVGKVNVAIEKYQKESSVSKAELGQSKVLEATKKALEADEVVIRTKIETLQKLVDGRQTPPKLLSSISTSIPKDVWLSELKADKESMSFKGFSATISDISDFMKILKENALLTDLKLVKTDKARDELGIEVSNFELQAKRR